MARGDTNFINVVATRLQGAFSGPVGTATVTGRVTGCITLALPVTAVANTDFTVTPPVGAILRAATTYTSVAYGAVTDAQISIGSTVGGGEYVAATTVKAIGVKNHTLVDAATTYYVNTTGAAGEIKVRIAQSGGNSATGTAVLVLEFAMPTSTL